MQFKKLHIFAKNIIHLSGKIAVFGAIFEVHCSICKLWDLLAHFDEKDTVMIFEQ